MSIDPGETLGHSFCCYNVSMNKSNYFDQLKDLPCFRVWRGGGSTIFFELGNKKPRKDGLESTQGEYTISSSSANWLIYQDDKQIVTDVMTLEEIDEQINKINGLILNKIELNEGNETLQFNNEITVKFVHPQSDSEWYILTPEKEIIITGSGVKIEDSE